MLELYFKTIDPTSLNRQGNDRGTQYRTGIYYTDKADLPVIEKAVYALAREYKKPLAIEIKPLTNFYVAEGYHQDYLDKNPGGYCHISPELFEMARKAHPEQKKEIESSEAVKSDKTGDPVYRKPDDARLKARLSPEQYAVTQKMQQSHLSGISIGMNTGKEFMSILRLGNLYLSLPINSIPDAAGLVFQNPFKKD